MNRHHRLRRREDIEAVRRQGNRVKHPLFILLFQPNNESVSRFGFSASRRVGNAVARNRAKRLLREAVRLHLPEIRPGWDCLFIARAASPTATFIDTESAVLQGLRRAHLLEIR